MEHSYFDQIKKDGTIEKYDKLSKQRNDGIVIEEWVVVINGYMDTEKKMLILENTELKKQNFWKNGNTETKGTGK